MAWSGHGRIEVILLCRRSAQGRLDPLVFPGAPGIVETTYSYANWTVLHPECFSDGGVRNKAIVDIHGKDRASPV